MELITQLSFSSQGRSYVHYVTRKIDIKKIWIIEITLSVLTKQILWFFCFAFFVKTAAFFIK